MTHPLPVELPSHQIAVYFDGGCPLCAKEIGYYQRLDQAQHVQWVDISRPNASCPIGFDQTTLLQRFHVKDLKTRQVVHGAAGFARLWCALPQPWRFIGHIASWAPVTGLLELGYRFTLTIRPFLVKLFR